MCSSTPEQFRLFSVQLCEVVKEGQRNAIDRFLVQKSLKIHAKYPLFTIAEKSQMA